MFNALKIVNLAAVYINSFGTREGNRAIAFIQPHPIFAIAFFDKSGDGGRITAIDIIGIKAGGIKIIQKAGMKTVGGLQKNRA